MTISKYVKYDKQIIKLAKEGKKPFEIAKEVGIDSRRVIDRLKSNNITNYKKGNTNDKLLIQSEEQKQVLLGTILGDGCLFKGNSNQNYRMNLAHGLKQKEYFMYKYNVLKSLNFKEPKIENEFNTRTEKQYSCIKTQSLTNPLFTEMYEIWYKDGKKIIPKSRVKELEDLAIAIIFFDDGYKQSSSYCIAMNNFDVESINNFRIMLLEKYGVETTLQKSNILYIRTNSKSKFRKIVEKYATSDVLYKLG